MADVDDLASSRLAEATVEDRVEDQGPDDDDREAEVVEEEDPYATSAIIAENTDEANGRIENSEKDLNSPDSNDSGIQADVQSFRRPSDDLDLYGVVYKPKQKVVISTTEVQHMPEESAEETKEPLSVATSKVDDVSVTKEKNLEDPYSLVEFDSPGKENEESAYAEIQIKKTKALKIKEKNADDEVNEHDSSGNIHRHADDTDGKDEDDKLSNSSDLPEGWQRHEDERGSYYWHVRSGITQREPPSPVLQTLPVANKFDAKTTHPTYGDNAVRVRTKTDLQKPPGVANVKVRHNIQNDSSTNFDDSSQKGFLVRCLGSLPLTEDELSIDRTGQAINQCISSLSHRSGMLQNERLQSRNLHLEFCGDDILLIDVNTSSVVRSESVKSVRVWGVGRETDSRDFAYVARDPDSDRHTCWVFKCERTGHEVANALRNVCLRIQKENENVTKKTSASARHNESGGNRLVNDSRVSKEWQKNQYKNCNDVSKKIVTGQSKHWNDNAVFPVPMSESKKVVNCHYLGMMKVPKPLGMDILNDAIEMIYAGVPSSKWVAVSIEVAPSAVTVYDRRSANSVIVECRIRFLTFLGIGINNCRLCAFIMHSAQNEFFAHVFHCVPDADLFCRTIKAACKLRYQKCLDAQTQKDRERGNLCRRTSAGSLASLQGLKESLQKGVSNFFGGNGKNQQQKG